MCVATLAVAIAIGAVMMRRANASKRASIARDARSLAVVGLGAALAAGFLIVVVLRAPFASFELEPNPFESTAKLVTDLARLWPAALVALLGVGVVANRAAREPGADDHGMHVASWSRGPSSPRQESSLEWSGPSSTPSHPFRPTAS